MKKTILIVTPKLSIAGGVSAYWNAILPILYHKNNLNITHIEIGGHGKNIFGILLDQWNFNKVLRQETDLAFLNPSLGMKSFFRDAFFAKQLLRKKIPFMVFFHGWDLDFEKKVEDKYMTFFLNTFGQAKKIFVLSTDFKNKILEWGYKGEVVIETTTLDSILINDFSIEEKQQKIATTDKKKILFLARLVREKGVFELVGAFESISKKLNDVELIIAGDGEDFQKLKQRVSKVSNVRVTGYVDGEDKVNLFKDCYIYCMPSYSEGLPISILEAMAFGVSIVTTDVGGLKEFFKSGEMGYFVKTHNVKDLEEKLLMLLTDIEKVKKISTHNYEYAQKYLLNTVVAKRIYGQLISALS